MVTTNVSCPSNTNSGGLYSHDNPMAVNYADPILLFIVQAVLIILFTRLLQYPLSFLRQPRVIAEILGGIILGPSVLSHIPAFKSNVFPSNSLPFLNLVANLGLVFFLFLVGLELDPVQMLKNARRTFSISVSGMALDFTLAVGVAYALWSIRAPDAKEFPFGVFYLFCAVAMSITAFPVLARILTELKLLKTPVGVLAISAAAVDDATSWCLLALVVSLVNASSGLNALWIFLTGVAYVVFVFLVVRRLFYWLIAREKGLDEHGPSQFIVLVTFLLVLCSAWFTGALGIHPIFGGFVIGVIVPHKGGFAVKLAEKFEDYVTILFLPLYFALSGLKTEIGLLNDGTSWGLVFLVIGAAILGKVTGVTLAALANGIYFRESFALGYVMTCKGLVELIVLNVGLEAGVLDKKLFAIMVVMALVTTMLTTPVVMWIYPKHRQRKLPMFSASAQNSFAVGTEAGRDAPMSDAPAVEQRLLVSMDKMTQVPVVMQMLAMVTQQPKERVDIHAVHFLELTPRMSSVLRYYDAEQWIQTDPIARVMHTFAELYQLQMYTTLTVCTPEEFANAIAIQAAEDSSDLVLIPWRWNPENGTTGRQVLDNIKQEQSSQRAFLRRIFRKVASPIAVVMDRGLGQKNKNIRVKMEGSVMNDDGARLRQQQRQADDAATVTLFFVGGPDDHAALELVKNMVNNGLSVTVVRLRAAVVASDSLEKEFVDMQAGNDDGAFDGLTSRIAVVNASNQTELEAHAAQLNAWDLAVVGRAMDSSLKPSNDDTNLGPHAEMLLRAGCKASLMVVRAYQAEAISHADTRRSFSRAPTVNE